MVKIVLKKNMDGAYYALAYDGEDIFKTNLFDTAEGARKEAAEKLCVAFAASRINSQMEAAK